METQLAVTVTVADCRKLGYCLFGLKTFAKQNGLEIRDLVARGWPIDRLELINDIYVKDAIAAAKERMNGR